MADHLCECPGDFADRFCHPWRTHNEGDVRRRLEHGHLCPQIVLSKLPAVVSKDHDDRLLGHLQLVQRVDQHPDVIIGVSYRCVVATTEDARARLIASAIKLYGEALDVRWRVPGD